MRHRGPWIALLAIYGGFLGCQSSTVSTASTGVPTPKMTWAEFQKLPPEERNDPYVLNQLDDAARAKWKANQSGKRP